jgi:aminopeptidase N
MLEISKEIPSEDNIKKRFQEINEKIDLLLEDLKVMRIDCIYNEKGNDQRVQDHFNNIDSFKKNFKNAEKALTRDFKEIKLLPSSEIINSGE